MAETGKDAAEGEAGVVAPSHCLGGAESGLHRVRSSELGRLWLQAGWELVRTQETVQRGTVQAEGQTATTCVGLSARQAEERG